MNVKMDSGVRYQSITQVLAVTERWTQLRLIES